MSRCNNKLLQSGITAFSEMKRLHAYAMWIALTAMVAIKSVTAVRSEDLQRVCFSEGNQTTEPFQAANTTGPCELWKDLTCCSRFSASKVKTNFNYDHCGGKMSTKCKEKFYSRACFAQCSPNLGPWRNTINDTQRLPGDGRFRFLPLCRSQCMEWWEHCKYERTCVENWTTGFNWTDGVNKCPNHSKCQTFQNLYKDATYFCEHVYGPFDFIVTNDNTHCMTIFERLYDNKFVAMHFADQVEALGQDKLYNYPYNLSDKIQESTCEDSIRSPETKYIILSFFMGCLFTTAVLFAVRFVIAKCKVGTKWETSRFSYKAHTDDNVDSVLSRR